MASKTPVLNTIIVYLIIIIIILLLKPNYMFNNMKMKKFGCSNDKTLLTFPIFCISIAFILYLLFFAIGLLNN